MAVNDKIKVTRNQLSEFISDNDTRKQIEKLIRIVNELQDRVAELEASP